MLAGGMLFPARSAQAGKSRPSFTLALGDAGMRQTRRLADLVLRGSAAQASYA